MGMRYEDIRKREAEYAAKLEKERDTTYSDLKKTKAKYDAACAEVEARRKKADSAFDYNKAKAQAAYQQQILEMHNAKNTYLIAIRATNKQKQMYYHEYVPALLDRLQDVNEARVVKLNGLWLQATNYELGMLKRSTESVNYLSQEIPRNVPQLDSMMFVRHNATPWQEPLDMQFQPSPVWHDDDAMITDETAKIFLRNLLTKSKTQMKELRQEEAIKKRDVEKLRQSREQIRQGQGKGDEVVVWSQLLSMEEQLHDIERARLTAEVETATIITTIGDLTIGAKNHNFKSESFKIPTNCDLCGERIWGLSAKGFDCMDCGYTCHSKCEMKAPADCPGEQDKQGKKRLKAERQAAAHEKRGSVAPDSSLSPTVSELQAISRSNTMNSLSSGYAASATRSISKTTGGAEHDGAPQPDRASKPGGILKGKRVVKAPPPVAYVGNTNGSSTALDVPSSQLRGTMLYAYTAQNNEEITVGEGDEFVLVEPDGEFLIPYLNIANPKADGSGWIKVRSGAREGLVPASYAELSSSHSPAPSATSTRPLSVQSTGSSATGSMNKKQGPAVAPRRGAKKLKYVEALYEYSAQSDAEFSMSEGDRFVLVKEDQGDGWAEVERGGVVRSVPASYVQVV
jgi:hypothetical protein